MAKHEHAYFEAALDAADGGGQDCADLRLSCSDSSVLFSVAGGAEDAWLTGATGSGDGAYMGRALLASTRVGEERTSGHRPRDTWMVAIKSAMQEMMSANLLSRFACSFCSSLMRTISSVLTVSHICGNPAAPKCVKAFGRDSMTANRSRSCLGRVDMSPPPNRWFSSRYSASVNDGDATMLVFDV